MPFLLFVNLMLVLNWLLFAAIGDPPRRDRPDLHLPHDPRKDLMPKIAFVGAGSAVFTRNLVGDILSLPELRDTTTFALMDIDAERLRTAEIVDRAAGRRARRAARGRGDAPTAARRSTAPTTS